ncbi:hypothetical protein IAR55_001515 [Kwoniella newhampshirensis]|uniref:NUC153 domain-containing protein n=1 Tax=Kwoniella newhampshirensis TaxID=1651941 RepID=A0AAW0Z2K2_9TREE
MSNDPRFARLKTDPRFRRPKQKNLKVEIDERFRDVLESEEFGGKGKGGGSAGARVDKRGRAIGSSHQADQLKRFYRLRSPDTDAQAAETDTPAFVDYARGEGNLSSSGDEDEDEGEDEESEVEEEELEVGGKRRNRLHGIESPSESSDDDDDEDHLQVDLSESDDDDHHESAFPDQDDPADEDEGEEEEESVPATKRIAAVNLDWDNLRAEDLYAVFNSFLLTSATKSKVAAAGEGSGSALGKLTNVKIYPSEFGKERMEREEVEGPGGGIFLSKEKDLEKRRKEKGKGKKREQIQIAAEDSEEGEDEDQISDDEGDNDHSDGEDLGDDDVEEDGSEEEGSEDEDQLPKRSRDLPGQEIDGLEIVSDVESDAGSEDIDMDQLRQYQLQRLRYFYAIATFSTVAAAEYVMNECNGTEFERTANIMDLSYVPEDMEFAEDDVKDEATKEPKGYKGNDFVTDALRHSKVKLTWDQDDPNRVKVTRRALTREEIEEQDFKNLVASSGSESESEPDFDDKDAGVSKAKSGEKKSRKQLMKERTEKLRNLLLANDEDGDGDVWGKAGTAWADELEDIRAGGKGESKATKGKGKKVDGDDMEITFRPGLSASKAGEEKDEENMTTLEKYQLRMKEKKQRKKEKIELRKAEKELGVEGEGEGVAVTKGGKDDFFGSESERESEEEQKKPIKSKSASSKSEIESKKINTKSTELAPHLASSEVDREADLLALMGSDPKPDTNFSMKDILKAEKETVAKRIRHRKKSGKKDEEEKELGPDGWKIDVRDERFKALHEEPEFAIDPSNPHFVKTKAMTDLLAERARIRSSKNPEPETRKSASGVSHPDAISAGARGEKDLNALAQSVKRRMDHNATKAKRKRTRK